MDEKMVVKQGDLKNRIAHEVFAAVKRFFRDLSDGGIIAFWLGALFLAAFLVWGLTIPLRDSVLRTHVNAALDALSEAERPEYRTETRRLFRVINTFGMKGSAAEAGRWFIMAEGEKEAEEADVNNATLAVVFPSIIDGIFSPALGVCEAGSDEIAIIPLTRDAEKNEETMSAAQRDMQLRRIKSAARDIRLGTRNIWDR